MATWVQIANKALRRLRVDEISSLDEKIESARKVKSIYEQVRDEVLSRHPWNCAIARASVAKDASAPAFGFANQFPLPTDPWCLRVLELDRETHGDAKWEVEGRRILTDEGGPLKFRFIRRITDPSQLSAWVADLIAANIALELAGALTNSATMPERMQKWVTQSLRDAKSTDAQEGTLPDPEEGDFIEARY